MSDNPNEFKSKLFTYRIKYEPAYEHCYAVYRKYLIWLYVDRFKTVKEAIEDIKDRIKADNLEAKGERWLTEDDITLEEL